MVDNVKPEPKFELIGSDGLFSGLLHLRYGTGQDDPMPFTLTLTPQYVAREIKKALPVSFLRVPARRLRFSDGQLLLDRPTGGGSPYSRSLIDKLAQDAA